MTEIAEIPFLHFSLRMLVYFLVSCLFILYFYSLVLQLSVFIYLYLSVLFRCELMVFIYYM